MKHLFMLVLAVTLLSCNTNKKEVTKESPNNEMIATYAKSVDSTLPTIGLLMYDGILQSEVIATSDVFSKLSADGKKLFNVVTIAQDLEPVTTEEGMRFLPDFTFESCPKLTALFVPSAYDMSTIIKNEAVVSFIKNKNKETDYIVSNCAGAQLIGASGIASGKKIVTWIGGGTQLQMDYPSLKVQDDSLVTYVQDGKFSSSNGNLASYISALELLEQMTSEAHRGYVEDYLYLDRLKNWK